MKEKSKAAESPAKKNPPSPHRIQSGAGSFPNSAQGSAGRGREGERRDDVAALQKQALEKDSGGQPRTTRVRGGTGTGVVDAAGDAEKKIQEYLDGWRRARAELDNFRKRMAEEQMRERERVTMELVEPLLGLADNFRAVVAHVPAELRDNAWAAGVVHVARQLESVLESYGVAVMPFGKEQVFDPARHEALETVKREGVRSGMVVEVVQPGYVMGERVIRPARVKVSV